jgi:hypothetical protein
MTADQNLEFQQNLNNLRIAVVVLVATYRGPGPVALPLASLSGDVLAASSDPLAPDGTACYAIHIDRSTFWSGVAKDPVGRSQRMP